MRRLADLVFFRPSAATPARHGSGIGSGHHEISQHASIQGVHGGRTAGYACQRRSKVLLVTKYWLGQQQRCVLIVTRHSIPGRFTDLLCLQVPTYTCRMASARMNADHRTPSPSSRIKAATAQTMPPRTKNRLQAAAKTALGTRRKSVATPTQDYTDTLHWTSHPLAPPEPQAPAAHSR